MKCAISRVFLGAGLLAAACGDDGGAAADPGETADATSQGGAPGADAATGGTGGAPAGGGGGALGGTIPDAGTPDAQLPDAAPPPPHLLEPQAWNYTYDPITDDGEISQVTLPETSGEDGRLTNASVQVFNCKKEEGGLTAMPFGNFKVSLCHEVQDTVPDADGHYLSIRPPADESDGNDQFAGVMMYRNVTRVHDYFSGTHGVDWLDFPLPAIVNLEFRIEPPVPIAGFVPGPDGWYDFPNAAYFPKESWNALMAQFGLPGRESDSIIFGQAGHDFSYDASVIMHEYTHAVIGTGRLGGRSFDRYGLDDAPRAMNEALADYFAATVAELPQVGLYGIGRLAPNLVRDLAVTRRCPDHLVNEIHADGRIFGAATWAIRTALGKEKADRIVFGALEQLGQETSFEQAGELLLAETQIVDAAQVDAVRQILVDHGVIGCERAKPWKNFSASQSEDLVPYLVEGKDTVGAGGFDEVPGFNQWYLDLEPGTAAVTLSWTMSGAGGLGGGGVGKVNLALRAAEPVEMSYLGRFAYTADQHIEVAQATQTPQNLFLQEVTLAADCLPADGGRLYLAMLNAASNAATIVGMRVRTYEAGETVPEDAPALTSCAPAPEMPEMPEMPE